MYFVNRGSSSFITTIIFIGLFLGAAFLFINLLPVILIAGVSIYAVTKGIKLFKAWTSKKDYKVTSKSKVEIFSEKQDFDMTDRNIIDVEYTDVK